MGMGPQQSFVCAVNVTLLHCSVFAWKDTSFRLGWVSRKKASCFSSDFKCFGRLQHSTSA